MLRRAFLGMLSALPFGGAARLVAKEKPTPTDRSWPPAYLDELEHWQAFLVGYDYRDYVPIMNRLANKLWGSYLGSCRVWSVPLLTKMAAGHGLKIEFGEARTDKDIWRNVKLLGPASPRFDRGDFSGPLE